MKEPNLFEFATSELSQDAFICWLLAWNDTELEEAKAAKEFIAFLYNSFMKTLENDPNEKRDIWPDADYAHVSASEVEGFYQYKKKMPLKQKFKTDVFFVVKIRDVDVAFIIEDKTNTSTHNNQLSRYVAEVLKSKTFNKMPLVRIYYKTGYIYPEDKSACSNACEGACINNKRKNKDRCKEICRKAPYCILDAKTMLAFLKKNEIDHAIFQDYMSFIETEYVKAQKDVLDSLQKNIAGALRKEYAKFEFMKNLAMGGGDFKPTISHRDEAGSSWAQYKLHSFGEIYGDIVETVFWRIERLKKGYVLTLRQFAYIKKDKAYSEIKKSRLKIYKKSFENIKGDKLEFGKAMSDYSGANSSQIALLYISDDGKNTTQNIYNELPRIHRAFLEEIPTMNLQLLK